MDTNEREKRIHDAGKRLQETGKKATLGLTIPALIGVVIFGPLGGLFGLILGAVIVFSPKNGA